MLFDAMACKQILYIGQGNKKGPIKRWDFENEEDYSQYQSKREALPK